MPIKRFADDLAARGELEGVNLVGLKRRGVERAESLALRSAYEVLKEGEGAFMDRARALSETATSPMVREMLGFILSASDRSFLTPK